MGTYIRLSEIKDPEKKRTGFFDNANCYVTDGSKFSFIPGKTIAYWITGAEMDAFTSGDSMGNFVNVKTGMQTGGNELYLREWFEVDSSKINNRWFFYNKGGSYRKWYGNRDLIVDWENNGYEIRHNPKAVIRNEKFYFKKGITWSTLANELSFRYTPEGTLFDTKGCMCFSDDESKLLSALALLNSTVSASFMQYIAPTLDFNPGSISKMPVLDEVKNESITELARKCITAERDDYDSYETSFDFVRSPLLPCDGLDSIAEIYERWKSECNGRLSVVMESEKRINEYYANLYDIANEVRIDVEENDVAITKEDLSRDIKDLISYAVGCVMGRYSLEKDGLVFAGGEWDGSKYKESFSPCEYGVIPITEEQFFEEDLCTKVIDFVKVVYGEKSLNDNLKFIASSLKPGSYDAPKKIIRDYLFSDFFDYHYQVYQHRPIYWQLDSGKAGGFRAILYMHRFNENTLPLVRTEFIQDLRYKYEEEMQRHKGRLDGASTTAERNAIKKDIDSLDKKIVECSAYDELLNHASSSIQNYVFDLDDGVKTNYAKFLSIDGDKTKNILTVIKL